MTRNRTTSGAAGAAATNLLSMLAGMLGLWMLL
jgi:hypothetical protein